MRAQTETSSVILHQPVLKSTETLKIWLLSGTGAA
jgi:hypothetical protein